MAKYACGVTQVAFGACDGWIVSQLIGAGSGIAIAAAAAVSATIAAAVSAAARARGPWKNGFPLDQYAGDGVIQGIE